jgi:ATP-dependent Clp endopeptidase proteolytic subunit ClpP
VTELQEPTKEIEEKQVVIINNISLPKDSIVPGRTVGLIGDINEAKAEEVLGSLLYLSDTGTSVELKDPLDLESEPIEVRKPIDLFISTYGGSVVDMFAIYDLISKLKQDKFIINTTGLGKVMSAGVLLLAAGTKGHRYIGQNCRIMIHNVLAGYHGSLIYLENEMAEVKWLQERYIDCLHCNTKLSRKKIKKMLSRQVEVYISAEDAVEYGIVDKII